MKENRESTRGDKWHWSFGDKTLSPVNHRAENICFCLAAALERKKIKKTLPMFFLPAECRLMSKMQSFRCKSAQKPCLFWVRHSLRVCACTRVRLCVSVYEPFFFLSPSPPATRLPPRCQSGRRSSRQTVEEGSLSELSRWLMLIWQC